MQDAMSSGTITRRMQHCATLVRRSYTAGEADADRPSAGTVPFSSMLGGPSCCPLLPLLSSPPLRMQR